MTDKPSWRAIYDRVSAEIDPLAKQVTSSDTFADAVEIAGAVGSRTSNELEKRSRRVLHAWNLPAGSDISVLRQEIGALTREVRALSRQVESLSQQMAESATPPARASAAESSRAKQSAGKNSTKRSAPKKSTSKKAG